MDSDKIWYDLIREKAGKILLEYDEDFGEDVNTEDPEDINGNATKTS
jgi:hypothetical protein